MHRGRRKSRRWGSLFLCAATTFRPSLRRTTRPAPAAAPNAAVTGHWCRRRLQSNSARSRSSYPLTVRKQRPPHLYEWLAHAVKESTLPKSWPRLGGPPRLRMSWLPAAIHTLLFQRQDWLMILLPIGLLALTCWREYDSERFTLHFFAVMSFACIRIGPITFPSRVELALAFRELRRKHPYLSAGAMKKRRSEWLQVLQEPTLRIVRDTGVLWKVRWYWLGIRVLFAMLTLGVFTLSGLSKSAPFVHTGWFVVVLIVSYFVSYRVSRHKMLNRLRSALQTPGCPSCGYDLSAYADMPDCREPRRCPECGCRRPMSVPPIAEDWRQWLTFPSP